MQVFIKSYINNTCLWWLNIKFLHMLESSSQWINYKFSLRAISHLLYNLFEQFSCEADILRSIQTQQWHAWTMFQLREPLTKQEYRHSLKVKKNERMILSQLSSLFQCSERRSSSWFRLPRPHCRHRLLSALALHFPVLQLVAVLSQALALAIVAGRLRHYALHVGVVEDLLDFLLQYQRSTASDLASPKIWISGSNRNPF